MLHPHGVTLRGLDAHPGQRRHLTAAQAGDPASTTGDQAGLAGRARRDWKNSGTLRLSTLRGERG